MVILFPPCEVLKTSTLVYIRTELGVNAQRLSPNYKTPHMLAEIHQSLSGRLTSPTAWHARNQIILCQEQNNYLLFQEPTGYRLRGCLFNFFLHSSRVSAVFLRYADGACAKALGIHKWSMEVNPSVFLDPALEREIADIEELRAAVGM